MLVVDAAHIAQPIIDAVGDRNVVAILCTHAHNDHVTGAPELGQQFEAPVLLHPDDEVLWKQTHLSVDYSPLTNDQQITFAGTEIRVIDTRSLAGLCVYAPAAAGAMGVVCAGDTLFRGGPGATGRSYSDFLTVIESIRSRLLTLPTQTVVHTGHGDDTTIGAEAPHLAEWIARGS